MIIERRVLNISLLSFFSPPMVGTARYCFRPAQQSEALDICVAAMDTRKPPARLDGVTFSAETCKRARRAPFTLTRWPCCPKLHDVRRTDGRLGWIE